MIQFKAKNKYWTSGDRWRKLIVIPKSFEQLSFTDYKYIIGDTIFEEPSDEAREAFKIVQMWMQLQEK